MRRWRVYLLHVELALGGAAHYVGIAKRERLLRRMREHVNGYGTRRTARYVAHGSRLRLARTWSTDQRELEREIEKADPKARLCPICLGRPRLSGYPINRGQAVKLLDTISEANQLLAFPNDRSEPQERLRKGPVLRGSP